jgi:hypothetical protein
VRDHFANILILSGLAALVLGLVAKFGLLDWFGSLPGDVHIKRDGFRLYLPFTSMLLLSLALSVLLHLFGRFGR